MSLLAPLYQRPASAFERLGIRVLVGIYASFLALIGLILISHPEWLPLPLGLLLGGLSGYILVRYPGVNIVVLIVGFFFISGYSKEVTPIEIIYALYYFGFITGWFSIRWFIYRQVIVRTFEDALLFFLLIYSTFSIVHNVVLGGNLSFFVNEWFAFLFLAFYFPVKEVVATWKRGPELILWAFLILGTLAGIRNLYVFITDLGTISHLWQFLIAREPINQHFFVTTSLMTLVLWLYEKRPLVRIPLFMLFALNFVSLIITQQRGFWIDFTLGATILFFAVPPRQRISLFTASFLSLLGVLLISWYFLGHTFWLILAGFADRLVSISSALVSDISMINRYYETARIWEYIRHNPLAGYGLGTPHKYYDLIHGVTMEKTWIHNGFVAIWYKLGVFGFLAIFTFWIRIIIQTWKTYRSKLTSLRLHALMLMISLIGLIPTTYTENPFHKADSLFLFAILTGWAAGLYQRMRHAS